jgi:SAM-dependent methyltransferase
MHPSSYLRVKLFAENYMREDDVTNKISVLEVGSCSYKEQDTYRNIFADGSFIYTGLDALPGPHVDIVPARPFSWDELADDSFDVCVCGQVFEHNPYFWVTFCDMVRVLKPGGHLCIVAPGAGEVHLYPHDCWRFYPDSWRALCTLSGAELVESWMESDEFADCVPGGVWRDSMVIARKPEGDSSAINARLRTIMHPFADLSFDLVPQTPVGPAQRAYEEWMEAHHPPTRITRLRRNVPRLRRSPVVLPRAGPIDTGGGHQ